MVFIFWKSTEHFVKITKCYLNQCQQTGFIHPAHPKHNNQAVKPKAGTRLCLHTHDFSHSLYRSVLPCANGCISGFSVWAWYVKSLFSPWFLTGLRMLWPFFVFELFFIFRSLEQIKNLCPELFVAWRAAIVALVLPSAVGVSCS